MDDIIKENWDAAQSMANVSYMQNKRLKIDPITRLEGHGKIDILLDDSGNVERAFLQVPELRGFEVFCKGRPAEDMPQITSRICGVCPTAHHMASTKALDDLFKVEPPPTAKKIRELLYNIFMLEDHARHVYFLGGPDFIVGPDAPKEQRNVIGVIQKVGIEVGKKVISARRTLRELITYLGGKPIHPVFGLPGGVAKGIDPADIGMFRDAAKTGLEFALFTSQVFKDIVLANNDYVNLIKSHDYTHETYYMGQVDENRMVNFYDGKIRVVDTSGDEFAFFSPDQYADHIAEHVEPWSYVKFNFLKTLGWKGFIDGKDTSLYSVAPLARLNVSDGMATALANAEYEKFFDFFGTKPVHFTLANHWARVIEMIYAAERINELVNDPDITGIEIRTIPEATPKTGIGVVEAPRGTLIHHYESDERGVITRANLIVATQHNTARIAMGVEKAAKGLIHNGIADDGILNKIEMAFRAYDPCLGCATHSLPGQMALIITLFNKDGAVVDIIKRN